MDLPRFPQSLADLPRYPWLEKLFSMAKAAQEDRACEKAMCLRLVLRETLKKGDCHEPARGHRPWRLHKALLDIWQLPEFWHPSGTMVFGRRFPWDLSLRPATQALAEPRLQRPILFYHADGPATRKFAECFLRPETKSCFFGYINLYYIVAWWYALSNDVNEAHAYCERACKRHTACCSTRYLTRSPTV